MASILVIAPHPDDAELGMGGTMVRLLSQGHRVHLVDMTDGEPTPLGSVQKRALESRRAGEILGVGRTQVGLPNRTVVHSVEARHKLAAVIRVHQADWLFVPYPLDAHPDHLAVTRIAQDARFDAKLTRSEIPGTPCYPKRIIYYYCTHLRAAFQPSFCLDITAQMEKKMSAVMAYESQFVQNNSPVPQMLRAANAYFGSCIGTAYAEPFFSYETLGFTGLDQLF